MFLLFLFLGTNFYIHLRGFKVRLRCLNLSMTVKLFPWQELSFHISKNISIGKYFPNLYCTCIYMFLHTLSHSAQNMNSIIYILPLVYIKNQVTRRKFLFCHFLEYIKICKSHQIKCSGRTKITKYIFLQRLQIIYLLM